MKTLGRYSLSRKLGAGAMGEVYLAQDTTLGRHVAIKILPEPFTSDTARMQRFQQEARVVSSLNHPNILTIHEVGEVDGRPYIVTEYIEGMTLRQRLQSGPIPVDDALQITSAIASALAEAHAAGIVHRDIKPENIMIRHDGLVKVLDFGLAKKEDLPHDDSRTALLGTAPGTILGTISYMSPEQARGLPLDARSDLFSTGAVAYEMLTGHRPFEGQTSTDVLAAILHREPLPLDRYRDANPPELRWLIEKALRKNRDERYQTAREMLSDLNRIRSQPALATDATGAGDRTQPEASTGGSVVAPMSSAEYLISGMRRNRWWVAAAGVIILATVLAGIVFVRRAADLPIDSIAVLPFETGAGDTGSEYIADGVTENLINNLAAIDDLRVIPRASVFRYKNSALPLEEIAGNLGARAVMTGRIVRDGDLLVVQADLIDVKTESQLWGERLTAPVSELMSLESRLARSALDQLRPHGVGASARNTPGTHDPEAYDLYMKGRFYWNERTAEDIRRSIELFEHALARDPKFARAWAALAEANVTLPSYVDGPSQSYYSSARTAALKALELDPALAPAHAALASVLFEYDWKPADAEREFQRAIAVDPAYPAARYWYSDFLMATGRYEEALAQSRIARRSDPLSIIAATSVAFAYTDSNQPDAALRELAAAREIDPDFRLIPLIEGKAYLQKGMMNEAAHAFDRAATAFRTPVFTAFALVLRGREAEARALLDPLLTDPLENPYDMATVYALLQEYDRAFEYLDLAAEQRSSMLVYIGTEFWVDPIRSDPRFNALLRRLGLPENPPHQTEWGRKLDEARRSAEPAPR